MTTETSGTGAKNTQDNQADDFVYDAKGRKDPFVAGEPLWTASRTAARLKESSLDGIVWDNGNSLVVLDGKVLRKGDKYLGAKLETIERDKAVFSVGEEKISVPVSQSHNGQAEGKDAKS